MASFASVIKQKSSNSVVLYRAVSKDGQDFYAYIRCNEKQYHKMKHDYLTKTSCKDARDYGEVIYTRLGKEPDAEAEAFLAEYLKNM
jgi:hypothetical protein